MLSFLAAALLQAAAPPVADPDIRCMAAYLFVVGQMEGDTNATDAERSGATTIVMYFFGKVRARTPTSDLKADLRKLVETPGYIESQLKSDVRRCGEEFAMRTKELEAFGGE